MYTRILSEAIFAPLLLLCLSSTAEAAGTVSPSNSALAAQAGTLYANYPANNGAAAGAIVVYPLTTNVGLNQAANLYTSIFVNGTIADTTAQNFANFPSSEIAYISCDSNSANSNIDVATIVDDVAASKPQGIILYSLQDSSCAINGTFGNSYGTIFTTTSIADAETLKNFADSNGLTSAVIITDSNTTSTGSSTTTQQQQPTGPTTAVAMSILYSITGIITVLFLIIIATGAIRAHRHPERYGPRHGAAGRPRQSRAKGLARAMLETLPIVKFGDDEPAKPTATEIEMENGTAHAAPELTSGSKEIGIDSKASNTAVAAVPVESGMGPDTKATAGSIHSKDEIVADTLGCSICTEDFTRGEDVRVLPCNHKYHPACIDPWLLNVSGTCPLCRIDLRPTVTNLSGAEPDSELPPPLEDEAAAVDPQQASIGGGRISIADLRSVPAAERLAALRALRAQRHQAQRDTAARRGSRDVEDADREHGSGHRLAMKLKEKFRVRTHRGGSEAVTESSEEASSSAPIPEASAPGDPEIQPVASSAVAANSKSATSTEQQVS